MIGNLNKTLVLVFCIKKIMIFFVFRIYLKIMSLTKEEINKLKKLSALDLNEEEERAFVEKLWDIINFLWKLKNIEVVSNFSEFSDNVVDMVDWVEDFVDYMKIMENVEHEKINNSIVVKSVLS